MDFGSRIRAARRAAGLSQEELARRAGMSLKGMGDIERGDIEDPHYSSLNKIAEGLGVPIGDLLEEPAPKAGTPSEKSSEEKPGAGRIAERVRELYQEDPDRFELLAIGSRDNWLPLKDYPKSTSEALQEVLFFLNEQGWDLTTSEARLEGNKLVRDAVDDVYRSADELELKRMERAEKVFLAIEEDLIRRGVITREEANERRRELFGTA